MWNKRNFVIALCGLTLAACGDEQSDVDYDPNWGTDQFAPSGKADLVDVAPAIEYGGSVSGEVTSTEVDLYKLQVQRGDKFTVTMNVKSGDLAPDASLFRSSGGSISSQDFSVAPKKLVKDYKVDSGGTLLMVARAFRNQGAGKYEISLECTGGPCNGEPFVTDPDDLDVSDTEECIVEAFNCSIADLPRWNGAVGETRAASIFNGCLARHTVFDNSCSVACDTSPDAQDLCSSVIRSLPFYADQSQACHETLTGCMDSCVGEGGFGFADEIWEHDFAMCWENGFNGTCDGFARQMPECGGVVQNDTAVCYLECFSSPFGVFNDDLDSGCRDDCGRCGVQCGRELDWGNFIPSDGLVGDIIDTFVGEVDPVALGDKCITFVQVYQVGDGELPPGIYGLVEDMDSDCNAEEHPIGEGVHATMDMLTEITDPNELDALGNMGGATSFYFIEGSLDHVE